MPLSMCAGVGVFLYGLFIADAPLYLHHDGVGVVTVSIDGQVVALLQEEGVRRLSMERGDRVVELAGARSARWELEGVAGLDEWLVVTNPDLCFAVVDVGPALRGAGDVSCDALDRTRVTCIYRRFPKRDVGGPIFDAADLPAPEARRLHTMWLAAPCSDIGELEAAELLADHLGCE